MRSRKVLLMNNLEKRILVISPFFFPEPISTGKFNTELVLALRDRVKHITVLCSHPFYPNWKVKKAFNQIDKVKIIRGGKNISYTKSSILRRLVLELWFAFFILKEFLKLRKNVDLIVSVYPPNMAFLFIKPFIKKGTETVALVHDLQGVYTVRKKGFLNKGIHFFTYFIEKNALKQSKSSIFLSTEMKETARKAYSLTEDKLSVSYPFITINEKETTNNLEKILSKEFQHIVYSGALGEKQNPYELYSFFDFASQRMKNTFFHFFSEGTIHQKLKTQNKNNSIKFHTLVHSSSILELYKKSTVQIVPQLQGTSKGSLPSKLPNILASGCKIMAITDKGGEIDKIFTEYNLNTAVTIWDNETLLRNLERVLEIPVKPIQKEIAIKLFNMNAMTDKILN